MKKYLSALPSYKGSKRKLLPILFHTIKETYPKQMWSQLAFLDAFSGGGSVSLAAKVLGFGHVISNDITQRGGIIHTALLTNHSVKLAHERVLQAWMHTGELDNILRPMAGEVFSHRHARALTQLRYLASVTHDPVNRALLQLLIWKLTLLSVAYGTSIGTSNRGCAQALDSGKYHLLNPNRLKDKSFERLSGPILSKIADIVDTINNSVVAAEGQVNCYQQDVFELLPIIQADIAFFDPPYANTVGYGKDLEILDRLLFGQDVQPVPESVFSGRVDAIGEMLDLAHHIPYWMLTYNDKVVSLDELIALVKTIAPEREVKGHAIRYDHMRHVSQRDNHELIITAIKKES